MEALTLVRRRRDRARVGHTFGVKQASNRPAFEALSPAGCHTCVSCVVDATTDAS